MRRPTRSVLALALVSGVMSSVFAAPQIPQIAGFTMPKSTAAEITPVRVAYGSAKSQFGHFRLPPGSPAATKHPVAVVIHGGLWSARTGLEVTEPIANDLAAAGVATWNIEYRRTGEPGGGWPNTLLDAAMAVDHLETLAASYPLDLARVVTLGHSAGGQLALWLAGRHRVPATSPVAPKSTRVRLIGAVSLAGITDVALYTHHRAEPVFDLLGGSPSDVSDRYAAVSPLSLLPLGVPQVLIHGTKDTSVSVEHSRNHFEAARKAGDEIRYVEIPDAAHFDLMDPAVSAVWPKTVDAVKSLLGRGPR